MKYLPLLSLVLVVLALAFTNPHHSVIVKGNVKDEKGNPIYYAAVVQKGTQTGTSTDVKGDFALAVSNANVVLVVSAVGFKSVEVKTSDKPKLEIVLKQETQTLSEVVVVGYGKQQKRSVTGSVAKISASSYTSNFGYSSQLQGRLSGVQVSNGNSNITVRGIASITGNGGKRRKDNKKNDDSINTDDEAYNKIAENPFLKATENPLSTFSIDVDAASYSNIRRYLNNGSLPPLGAVRIEEMVNYFTYQYPQPKKNEPFSVNTEISECPWNAEHKLVLIGLQGKKIETAALPASNLVFLIDVSGSMDMPNKLPLVKASMKLLIDQLRQNDKVSIVVYAGNAGLVLPPTNGLDKQKITDAIDRLEAGGSTAGGAGIQLAYKTAKEHFVKGGNNRVILCTDGDFNVGVSSNDALEKMIEDERKSGVFLTVLGYGMGNYKDDKMQLLADKGNGNHAYIDGISEAKKVLVNEFGGTLFTIAKDVKLQIEFNAEKVQGYRLIGYENRMLAKEDFNNDKKDAGELGSGHTVTALYEIIPTGIDAEELNTVDTLRYQKNTTARSEGFNDELIFVKLRYKKPDEDVSSLIQHAVKDEQIAFRKTSENFRFAASVAEFGLLLMNSAYKGDADFESVKSIAQKAQGTDKEGYRKEFIKLVDLAATMHSRASVEEEE